MNGPTDRVGEPRSWLAANWRRVILNAIAVVATLGVILFVTGVLWRPNGEVTSTHPTPSANASGAPAGSATASSIAATSPTPSPTPSTEVGWTPVEITGVPWVADIAEGEGTLVAVGSEGSFSGDALIAYSDDGFNWTPVDTSHLDVADALMYRVVAGAPGFVAFAVRNTPAFAVEDLYFFSADGRDWEAAAPPEHCSSGYNARAVGGGFIVFGQECVGDGMAPPGLVRILTSSDGRSWTSRLDADAPLGPWTTDGERIVMVIGCCGVETAADIAISDDTGTSWTTITDAFPDNVSIYSLAYGHGRYVAEASWLRRAGNPDHAVCSSATGETWTCEALSPGNSPPQAQRSVGPVAATPTGFAALRVAMQQGNDIGVTIMATSADGLEWTFSAVEAMPNVATIGLVGTSYGAFSWGETIDPEEGIGTGPYVMVHRAPLP
jgi:hypothetical protein